MRLKSLLTAVMLTAVVLVTSSAAWAQSGYSDDELPLGMPGLEETRDSRQLGTGVTYTEILRAASTGPGQPAAGQVPLGSNSPPGVGPWAIHVLEIAPGAPYALDLVAGLDTTAEREFTTGMTVRSGAVAGVNGGYFVTNEGDGITGEPAGLGVYDGDLTSEAVQGRANFVVNGPRPQDATVQELFTDLSLIAPGGETFLVDGVNRKHSLVRMCGGVGGDTVGPEPFTGQDLPAPGFALDGSEPYHDWTCIDDTEVIVYNDQLGIAVPPADLEVRLGPDSTVTSVGPSTDAVVEDETMVVTATGAEPTAWLQTNAVVGQQLTFVNRIVTANGTELPLTADLEITNGGPRLLRDGEVDIDREGEGFSAVHPIPGFGAVYADSAQPRLLAGTRPDGTLLFVLADGRRPEHSQGLSFEESADVMLSLGAVEAINLDGGGSAAMSDEHGELLNVVSGPEERDVSDALVLVPIEDAADTVEDAGDPADTAVDTVLALATSNLVRTTTGQPVAFDGLASTAGDDARFEWDFGDGDTATGEQVTHVFDQPGLRHVTLTVTEDGLTSQDVVDVQIVDIVRREGATRIDTAIDISASTFPSSDVAVLATATDYADALAGAPLAAANDAPLLLTGPSALPDVVSTELDRLGARSVVLLGGADAIAPTVEDTLRANGFAVERVAGDTRFTTAVEIARRLGSGSQVFLVEGADPDPTRGWPDALGVAPLAAHLGRPVLLAETDRLPRATAAALTELGITNVTAVGGPVALSQPVLDQVRARGAIVERVSGNDRYATSALVAERGLRAGLEEATVHLATGRAFPDALAGGPAAAAERAVLLLVDPTSLDSSIATRDVLVDRLDTLRRIQVLGGPVAVSEAVERELRDLVTTLR